MALPTRLKDGRYRVRYTDENGKQRHGGVYPTLKETQFRQKQLEAQAGEIRRGDAAIFVYPNDRTTMYVKRIIGLPGDQIEIHDTDVLVNGKSIRGPEVKDLGSAELNPLLVDHFAYTERADGDSSYVAIWKTDTRHEDQKITVPNGQVYVLGDNCDGSHESLSRAFQIEKE